MNMTRAADASTQAVSPVLIFTGSPFPHAPWLPTTGALGRARPDAGHVRVRFREHHRGLFPSGRGNVSGM